MTDHTPGKGLHRVGLEEQPNRAAPTAAVYAQQHYESQKHEDAKHNDGSSRASRNVQKKQERESPTPGHRMCA